MARGKKILLVVLVVFLVIQLIQPARNRSSQLSATEISRLHQVPDSVQHLLKTACYDCHSNNTVYPWYTNIQPVGWYLAHHVKEGKAELNFSDFGSYSRRKQRGKLQGIISTVRKDEMPLPSYKILHPAARLTAAEKKLIIDWAAKTKESLSMATQNGNKTQ